jgi:ferredoxin
MAEVVKKKPTTAGKRKRKPKEVAFINDSCTGCAGSPVCLGYCPVPACMVYVDDPDTVFGRVWVDPDTCIGCQKCTSKGPDGLFLDGCPWDAIDMVATDEWEAEYGEVD